MVVGKASARFYVPPPPPSPPPPPPQLQQQQQQRQQAHREAKALHVWEHAGAAPGGVEGACIAWHGGMVALWASQRTKPCSVRARRQAGGGAGPRCSSPAFPPAHLPAHLPARPPALPPHPPPPVKEQVSSHRLRRLARAERPSGIVPAVRCGAVQ